MTDLTRMLHPLLRGGSLGKLSRVALLYVGVVAVAAVAFVARGPFTGLSWHYIVALGILVIIAESRPTPLRQGQLSWTPSSVAMLASVVLIGPVGAALVGTFSALAVRRGPTALQRGFNAAVYALSAYLAGRTFLALGGQVGLPQATSFPKIIGPFAAAAVV